MALKTHIYRVSMSCEGCCGAIEKILNKKKGQGVESFEINLSKQTVKVVTSLSSDEILNVIQKAGKPAELISSS